jgi:hypothetical protein
VSDEEVGLQPAVQQDAPSDANGEWTEELATVFRCIATAQDGKPCEARPHPRHAFRCALGHVQPGNQAARKQEPLEEPIELQAYNERAIAERQVSRLEGRVVTIERRLRASLTAKQRLDNEQLLSRTEGHLLEAQANLADLQKKAATEGFQPLEARRSILKRFDDQTLEAVARALTETDGPITMMVLLSFAGAQQKPLEQRLLEKVAQNRELEAAQRRKAGRAAAPDIEVDAPAGMPPSRPPAAPGRDAREDTLTPPRVTPALAPSATEEPLGAYQVIGGQRVSVNKETVRLDLPIRGIPDEELAAYLHQVIVDGARP